MRKKLQVLHEFNKYKILDQVSEAQLDFIIAQPTPYKEKRMPSRMDELVSFWGRMVCISKRMDENVTRVDGNSS